MQKENSLTKYFFLFISESWAKNAINHCALSINTDITARNKKIEGAKKKKEKYLEMSRDLEFVRFLYFVKSVTLFSSQSYRIE